MGVWARLKDVGWRLRREIRVYQQVLRDPRTPHLSKALLWLAVGYTLLPFDLLPDFIPLVGHLDDLVIVPALVILAMRLVPGEVFEEARAAVSGQKTCEPPHPRRPPRG